MTRAAPRHAAGIAALTVGKADAKTLQDFLASRFSLSRRSAKAVIDGRQVWVNRRSVWIARYELATGDVVEVPAAVVKAAQSQAKKGDEAPSSAGAGSEQSKPRHVRVLWQDDDYLVCDKPSGLVSCDDPRSVESILRVQEGVPTLEAVHRLDRDTTGCLLFAKRHAAFEAAVGVFKTHRVSKLYHAIVAGSLRFQHQTIETPLDGESAVSKVTRESVGDDATLVRVRIETGRTNQIRRHLASVRAPILGDRVFGFKSVRDSRLMRVPRQMLHASTLSLPNPLRSKEEISVHSPLPADFRTVLKLFGMGKKS